MNLDVACWIIWLRFQVKSSIKTAKAFLFSFLKKKRNSNSNCTCFLLCCRLFDNDYFYLMGKIWVMALDFKQEEPGKVMSTHLLKKKSFSSRKKQRKTWSRGQGPVNRPGQNTEKLTYVRDTSLRDTTLNTFEHPSSFSVTRKTWLFRGESIVLLSE